MRQTEIDYRVLPNGRIEFMMLRHVASQNEIEKELQPVKARRYYHGRSYYSLATIAEPNTVRISNQHEMPPDGWMDFKVGETYTVDDWDFFVHFLKSAGERYTRIHHAKEAPLLPIMTVKI